jgi:hypothetical protein
MECRAVTGNRAEIRIRKATGMNRRRKESLAKGSYQWAII